MKTVGAGATLKVGATAQEFRERANDLPLRTSAALLLKLVTVHAYQAHKYVLQARKNRSRKSNSKRISALAGGDGVGGSDNVADASRINRRKVSAAVFIDESLFEDLDDDQQFLTSSGSDSEDSGREGDFWAHTAPENALSMSGRADGGSGHAVFALGSKHDDFDAMGDGGFDAGDFGGGFEFEADQGADGTMGDYSQHRHDANKDFYKRKDFDGSGGDLGPLYDSGGFENDDDVSGGFDDVDETFPGTSKDADSGLASRGQNKNASKSGSTSRNRLWKTIEGPSRIESAIMQMSINDTR